MTNEKKPWPFPRRKRGMMERSKQRNYWVDSIWVLMLCNFLVYTAVGAIIALSNDDEDWLTVVLMFCCLGIFSAVALFISDAVDKGCANGEGF